MNQTIVKPTLSEQTLKFLDDNFDDFKYKIEDAIKTLFESGNPIVTLNTKKNELWDIYLNSIADEHNPIFRTRKYFNGTYDHQFFNRIGSIAMITQDYDVIPLWSLISLSDDSIFKKSLDNLQERTSKASIKSIFLSEIKTIGSKPTPDNTESIIWTHYYTLLDNTYVSDSKNTQIGKLNDIKQVFIRSVEEASSSDIKLVLELIDNNSIYRGAEFKTQLEFWNALLEAYHRISPSKKEGFVWYKVITQRHKVAFRNTVIGSLITDLFEGKSLEDAVRAYEVKVAPENYKRPTALVTAKMVKEAQEFFESLGYSDSFYRTAAQPTDIPSQHILLTSQDSKPVSVFDELTDDANRSTRKIDISKATKRTIPDLLNAFPNIASIEILPTSQLKAHEMVLTKGQTPNTKSPFKWDNDLSWSYINNGGAADAIKERVKSAGGNIHGDLRISLSWDNNDDLDLAAKFNNDNKYIYFGNRSYKNGTLDVDANAHDIMPNPVENIYWTDENLIPNGDIIIEVNNYNKRSSTNQGFALQVEFKGAIYNFSYHDNKVKNKSLLKLKYDKSTSNFTIDILDSKLSGGSISVLTNEKFIPIKTVMLSPNAWSDKRIGNKHLFFLTNDIDVKEPVIGFFNEQLSSDLEPHRKMTSILSSKLRIAPEEFAHAASGYGISETMKTPFYLRITFNNGRKELIECSN